MNDIVTTPTSNSPVALTASELALQLTYILQQRTVDRPETFSVEFDFDAILKFANCGHLLSFENYDARRQYLNDVAFEVMTIENFTNVDAYINRVGNLVLTDWRVLNKHDSEQPYVIGINTGAQPFTGYLGCVAEWVILGRFQNRC